MTLDRARADVRSLSLVLSLVAAVSVAACSGDDASSSAANAPVSPTGTTVDQPTAAPVVTATKLQAELAAAGIDIDSPPSWDALIESFEAKASASNPTAVYDAAKPVMELIATSLGVECKTCHSLPQSSVPEERKRLVKGMWDQWVRGLRSRAGGPLFCDSCHQGKPQILAREDKKALSTWMRVNFVDSVTRVDGAKQACSSCHGDPFNGTFLDAWIKGN